MGDKILILFDLDDTLTPKGQHMQDFMFDKLSELNISRKWFGCFSSSRWSGRVIG